MKGPPDESVELVYLDPHSFEHDEAGKVDDAATNAVIRFHRQHRDDGNQESGLDLCYATDFEWEQLRYHGGAGSHYWDAEGEYDGR